MTVVQSSAFDRYFASLVEGDPAAATDVVLDLLESGASLGEIVQDLLAPAQSHVGELWERGEWSVAQEHSATAVTEAAVSALWVMTARRRLRDGPRVALACAEGEWHALPARMAAALAAEAGAQVTVLGPSMPSEELRRRLEVRDVDLLAVSCTVTANLVGAARCVQAAHDAGVPVVVGGRAFAGRVQRARAVGAGALVTDAQQLGERLPAVGGHVAVPDEARTLTTATDRLVDPLLAPVVAACPGLDELPARRRARVLEDLRELVRSTGAAVLTADPSVLDDVLPALLRLSAGRVPGDALLGAVDVLADELEPLAPHGAQLLREAVRRAAG